MRRAKVHRPGPGVPLSGCCANNRVEDTEATWRVSCTISLAQPPPFHRLPDAAKASSQSETSARYGLFANKTWDVISPVARCILNGAEPSPHRMMLRRRWLRGAGPVLVAQRYVAFGDH